MIREFQYTFSDLQLVPRDIAELIGFNSDSVPDPFPGLIEVALKESPDLFQIRAGFKHFDSVEIDIQQQKITIDNQIFSPGKIIFTQLKKATSVAIFLCTAGEEISNHSKQLALEGDQLLSYVFDVIGSLAAEKTLEKLKAEMEKELINTGMKISDPHSPGYCNWNISEQQNLFSLLPDNFCGITLSSSFLMNPIKSVSGFWGIGKTMKQSGYQCYRCGDANCLYGRIKRQKKS